MLSAIITPFAADGSVNYSEAARFAAYAVDVQKNDGLVVSGTTGESPTLSEHEKLELLRVVLDAVGDRAAVVFGAGTYNTTESIELTKRAEKLGAHGIMLVSPYYSRPGQAGLEAHFRSVAEQTDLPVMLYNIAGRTAINLETSTLLRLTEVPNIVAVKEASGALAQITDVCTRVPEGFRVYSGDDALTLPILSVGGHGVVSVAGQVVGRVIQEQIVAFLAGRNDEAIRLQKALLPFYQAIFAAPNPVPVKAAAQMLGYEAAAVRLPLVPLTESERCRVAEELDRLRPF